MPVATLRVWERRYALTTPTWSTGGQRLYSDDDVKRLALLRQLNGLGHAIGSVAGLDLQGLQRVVATHANPAIGATWAGDAESSAPPWRLAVVGESMGARLASSGFPWGAGRAVDLVGPFGDDERLAARLERQPVDALLWHLPELPPGDGASARRLRESVPASLPIAVVYRYGSEPAAAALSATGAMLLREPQPDVALGQWLRAWLNTRASPAAAPLGTRVEALPSVDPGDAVAAPRWDDAALAEFAARSQTVACECPRHVAELVAQLSHFEAYSAGCAARNPADARLHAFLRQVAAQSRARFEAALARIAAHEGLPLPPGPRAGR